MTQLVSLNVKLSNSQLNNLIKLNVNWIKLNLVNLIADSNGEANFPNKLLLNNRQVSRLLQIIDQLI